jgi:hypothetical protein
LLLSPTRHIDCRASSASLEDLTLAAHPGCSSFIPASSGEHTWKTPPESHGTLLPFVFLSFAIWLCDCINDMVIIELLWSSQLPNMYSGLGGSEVTYLNCQTLTINLYAPLLLLVLLVSLAAHARPQAELSASARPSSVLSAVTIMARYDFHLSQAVTAACTPSSGSSPAGRTRPAGCSSSSASSA